MENSTPPQNRSWSPSLFLRYGQQVLARCAAVYQQLCNLPRQTRRRVQVLAGANLTAVALAIALHTAPVGAGPAATIAVNPGSAGVATDGGCSLVEAILTANDGGTHGDCSGGTATMVDTINLTGHTYTYTAAHANSVALPAITDSVIINGNGATVTRSGNADFKLLHIANTDATLNDIALTNGRITTSDGGAIYSVSSNITLNNATISGNHARQGGGIYAKFGTTTINDSEINNNVSASFDGGGLASNRSPVTINRSTISGNQARQAGGGVQLFYTSATINHSQISGNIAGTSDATKSGGGVYVRRGSLAMHDTEISNNSAPNRGGGIYLNWPTGLQISQATITNNESGGTGGGISTKRREGVTATITNSTLTGNRAGGDGGAIYETESSINLLIQRSTIANNSTTQRGGAISLNNKYQSSTTLIHSTISGNQAGTKGGGIYAKRYYSSGYNPITVTADNTTIIKNQADIGGALYGNVAGFYTRRSIVSGNTAVTSHAEIRAIVGSRYDYACYCSVPIGGVTAGGSIFGDSSQTNMSAFGEASPAWITASDATLTSDGTNPTAIRGVLNTTLADNGGLTHSHALVSGSPAINHVTSGASGQNDQRYAPRVGNEDAGSAEYGSQAAEALINGTACTISDAMTAANSDTATGACAAGTAGADTITLLRDITLTNFLAATSEITIEGHGRTLDANGGNHPVILNQTPAANLTLNEIMITGSHSDGSLAPGAVFAITGSTLNINNSTIHNNQGHIAGFLNLGTMNLTNSTISHNTGTTGGGINTGSMTIRHSTITQNTATAPTNGVGGISHSGSSLTIENSIFSGNSGSYAADLLDEIPNISTKGNNLFGDSSKTNLQAFGTATPAFLSANDLSATSDGTKPTALNSILNTTLALNGGKTLNHNLVNGSPAINSASAVICTTGHDQRGVIRPQFQTCDIGAVEANFDQFSVTLAANGTATILYDRSLGVYLHQATTPFGTYSQVDTTGTHTHANGTTAPSYWQLKTPQGQVVTTFSIFPFGLTTGP